MRRRIEFAEETNPWSVYICEDGTRFRIRHVLVSVHATGEKLPNGSPQHELQFSQIIEQIDPVAVTRKTGAVPD
jgi:hypothetical protein